MPTTRLSFFPTTILSASRGFNSTSSGRAFETPSSTKKSTSFNDVAVNAEVAEDEEEEVVEDDEEEEVAVEVGVEMEEGMAAELVLNPSVMSTSQSPTTNLSTALSIHENEVTSTI